MERNVKLGIGIGWRPEIADAVEALPGVDWVETVAENICPGHLPASLERLLARGTKVVPHGVSLGLGGADRPDAGRLADLAARVETLGAPLVTEHIAFVRAGGARTASTVIEAGHLLPVPRTRDALRVLCENVRIAQDSLPVPLALENIAALINWPDEELTEGQFLAELVERTGVRLLIDVANLHTNHVNRGEDPAHALDELPVEAIAYVHVAGGVERDGVWHDTHAHPVPRPVLDVLAELRSRVDPPGVLLERDDDFPSGEELADELDAIRATLARSSAAPRVRVPDGRPGAADGPQLWGGAGTGVPLRAPAALRATAHRAPAVPTRGAGEAPLLHPASSSGTLLTAPRPTHDPHAERVGREPARDAGPAPTGTDSTAGTEGTAGTGSTAGTTSAADASGTSDATNTTTTTDTNTDTARDRLALAQTALLSALVAGTPAPDGFDRARLAVQSRALTAKRAGVVAKVAPELPGILGDGYRAAFLAYAKGRPMTSGYRRDALNFAESLLIADRPADPAARRALTLWWEERAAPRPPSRASRLARAVRTVFSGK
ncbi:DUF692 family multinuclear iron-containing protein [Streptomyces sp. NPDC050504]|uniref:multinuclear nonheme iron-dependent oxidase n=1 Tax=Streptomyces sp. NPDC050504 TaxID=3365618 RepID=UPI0037946AC0